MDYRVIKKFLDLNDNYRKYDVGDVFPRVGLKVSEERIMELLTGKNRRGIPLIEEIEEEAAEAEEAENENAVIEEKAEDALDKVEATVETAKPKKGRKKNAD